MLGFFFELDAVEEAVSAGFINCHNVVDQNLAFVLKILHLHFELLFPNERVVAAVKKTKLGWVLTQTVSNRVSPAVAKSYFKLNISSVEPLLKLVHFV